MQKRGRPVIKGRWRAIALSVVLHSGIVAAAVYGWFTWKHRPPPPETLAIDAVVVDEKMLKGVAPAPEPPPPEPQPEPPPPEPVPEEQGPPAPDPAEIERQREEERLAQEKLEQQQAQEKERLDAEKEAEKQAVARAAAEKAAAEKAAAEKKALEKKKAEDAAAAKKAAEEKAQLARQAELRRAMEAEERGNVLRSSEEASRWHAAIVARITRAWIPPPSLPAGVTCIVLVSQTPSGEVQSARVENCSVSEPALNAALAESVETAVKRASPLPAPPNPALFEPNLKLIFAP